MTSFLVYRHGSNAANQSMTPVMAVAIVDAPDEQTARKVAADNITTYANQRLSFVAENDITENQCVDWSDIISRNAEMLSIGLPGLIFSE